MATAFGVSAYQQFFNVKYIRLPKLLDELSVAKLAAGGSYQKSINIYESRPPYLRMAFDRFNYG